MDNWGYFGCCACDQNDICVWFRARGDNKNPHSDIDIGVVAENRLSFLHLAKIEGALDRLDTLYTVEVVDFTQREDAFTREALRDMVLLYEKR